MPEAKFLQSYVVPVCTYEPAVGVAHLRSSQGTAFFVNNCGVFLTAAHVLSDAFKYAADRDQKVGLCVKGDDGESEGSFIAEVNLYEPAPDPFDIAIGMVPYFTDSPLALSRKEVSPWQEVATLGYPLSASAIDEDDAIWMNLRAHRGYIQRPTLPRDMRLGKHPAGMELNFLISPGLSGAPIFTTPDEIIVGVAVGSFRSEYVDDSTTEIEADGSKFKETRIRIEQFGFAHDVNGLLDWVPSIFGGKTLLQIAELKNGASA